MHHHVAALYCSLPSCSIASAGNDHRLGAQEAPPAIISLCKCPLLPHPLLASTSRLAWMKTFLADVVGNSLTHHLMCYPLVNCSIPVLTHRWQTQESTWLPTWNRSRTMALPSRVMQILALLSIMAAMLCKPSLVPRRIVTALLLCLSVEIASRRLRRICFCSWCCPSIEVPAARVPSRVSSGMFYRYT